MKELSKKLPESLSGVIAKGDEVEVVKAEGFKLYVVNGFPLLVEVGESLYPTLHALLRKALKVALPRVVVDKGAVKPVSNGADVMRPGIVRYDEFDKGSVVVVVEETRELPLAVGVSMVSSQELEGMKKGRVIKNVHHVGDKIWDVCKSILRGM